MFRRSIVAALLAVAFLICPARPEASTVALSEVAAASVPAPELFPTEATAQAHCPKDTVVWLNTDSGIYHEKGMRWYGRTKHGAYVCKMEADSAGDRDTRNGQ